MPPPDPVRRIMDVVVPRAVDSIDLNEVLGEIDLDQTLKRVDVDAILERIDLNAVLERVDLDKLLARLDLDSVLDRIDLNRVLERIDLVEIVKRAEVDAIVAATAGGLGNRLLDLLRRQLVGLDIIVTRLVGRVFRRGVGEPAARDGSFTGELAGGASRLAAFFVDLGIVFVVFSVVVALVFFMASLFVGHQIKASTGGGLWHILAFVAFALIYQWIGLVVAGRTLGRALAGLRVTAPDGSPLRAGASTRRVLVYPFSFILGLGLVGIVIGRRHRALHDVAAPSLVRYDWGDRPAEMPAPIMHYLERRGVGVSPRVADQDLVAIPESRAITDSASPPAEPGEPLEPAGHPEHLDG